MSAVVTEDQGTAQSLGSRINVLRMRRICTWCKEVTQEGDPGGEVVNTLCDTCFKDAAVILERWEAADSAEV